MGLGWQTGNGMNWKAVKALLGQSVLLVMWAIVNRLSSDLSLAASLPVTVSFLDDTRRCEKSLLPDSLTDLSSPPAATKADGFALYFLGECNNVSAEHVWRTSAKRRFVTSV